MIRQHKTTAQRGLAKQRAARGFTLIELLTLAAILAVLFAVLAPVLAQAREKIRAYTCQSNLRQIGLATTLYAQDYDEQYACLHWEPQGWLPDVHQAYLKQWHVWICPSDTRAKMWDGEWGSPTFAVRVSYISNAYVFQGDATTWDRSIGLSSIPYPSTLAVWAEGYANPGWVSEGTPISTPDPKEAIIHNAYGDNMNAAPNDPTAGPCSVHYNERLDVAHHGGGNYAFADGHTRWLHPSAFTTAPIVRNGGDPVDDRSDPFVTNGARAAAISGSVLCPVFCCVKDIGTPPSDGERPWFRP